MRGARALYSSTIYCSLLLFSLVCPEPASAKPSVKSICTVLMRELGFASGSRSAPRLTRDQIEASLPRDGRGAALTALRALEPKKEPRYERLIDEDPAKPPVRSLLAFVGEMPENAETSPRRNRFIRSSNKTGHCSRASSTPPLKWQTSFSISSGHRSRKSSARWNRVTIWRSIRMRIAVVS